MREKIRSTLKTYKDGLIEKNKVLAQKGKEVKKENEFLYSLYKQSIDERNKNICTAIKAQEKDIIEKRKREEV